MQQRCERENKCISPLLRNNFLQAVFGQRSKILSFAMSSAKHASVPALLRFEHPVLVIYPRFIRSPSIEKYFELPRVQAILSVVIKFVHFLRRAVGYCRQQSCTFLYKPCNNTQFPNHPPYVLLPQHNAVHTQYCPLDTRRYLSVCPAVLLVDIVLCRHE